MNIEFHIGPRNCGKSVFVEQKMENFNKLFYIATLPQFKIYTNTIISHRKRRSQKWTTIELSFNLEEDIHNIKKQIYEFCPNCAILLDGIWTWYVFQTKIGNTKINALAFADFIIEIVNSLNAKWFFVDICNQTKTENDLYAIHNKIIEKLNINTIIDWRYE